MLLDVLFSGAITIEQLSVLFSYFGPLLKIDLGILLLLTHPLPCFVGDFIKGRPWLPLPKVPFRLVAVFILSSIFCYIKAARSSAKLRGF